MNEIKSAISRIISDDFGSNVEPTISRPDEKFGDFSTNIALVLSPQLKKSPRDIAGIIAAKLQEALKSTLTDVTIEGPGFINMRLEEAELTKLLADIDDNYGKNAYYDGKTVVIEHTDTNPFKEFHIGHAYTNTIGVAVGRLYEAGGAQLHQVSYHGDVGMQIAMAIWSIKNQFAGVEEFQAATSSLDVTEVSNWLGAHYAHGAKKFGSDPVSAEEIKQINIQIYDRSDDYINFIHEWGRQASFDDFQTIYEDLSFRSEDQTLTVEFEKQYLESTVGSKGAEIVQAHLEDKIFEESAGAIVFKGEEFGLHTRVFINQQGLPTYEAKELGLIYEKVKDYPRADKFVVVTANEISEYFKVLVAAINQLDPSLAAKLLHIPHGVVKLSSGKMSSRTGKVMAFRDLEKTIKAMITDRYGDSEVANQIFLGAIKYAFLKQHIGGNVTYSIERSISLEGDSGPYIQYAHARASSIIAKASQKAKAKLTDSSLTAPERSLVRTLSLYPEIVEDSCINLSPSLLCGYLHNLAKQFNKFYEQNRIIDDEREYIRLEITAAVRQILRNGLGTLNIPAPEKI